MPSTWGKRGAKARGASVGETWDEGDNPWRITGVTRAFANDWLVVESSAVIHPNGEPGVYSVVRPRRVAVGVLPIDAQGWVHLVGQWRFPLGRYSWEMPEGGAELDEEPLACARRELGEETGMAAGSYCLILEMDLSNSLTDERAVVFLATDLQAGQPRPDATEVLQQKRAPFMVVLERVANGRVRDAMTVAAVLRAHHMAVTGQLPADLAAAMLSSGE